MLMRITTLFIFLLTSINSLSQLSYDEEIEKHRDEINLEFRSDSTSILTEEDRVGFSGLEFFAPDYAYNVEVRFKKLKKGEVIGFSTSTDRIAKYRPYGILKFKIDGVKCKLTIYAPAREISGYPGYLFLPFKDFTNGQETYGGGRYLDLKQSDLAKKFRLDFNLCYNPYCAYSNGFSCPVPPDENHLDAEIKAGVKSFH
tara:strand:- start:1029 stop:1628 length:600 start_codon:yes stop_codon:yes gene_type:complete